MELLAAFTLGIAGSLHCLGMCGPLALALPRPRSVGVRSLVVGRLLYNVGRVTTYIVLGFIIGLGGTALSVAGIGQTVSIVAGSLMVVMAVVQLAMHRSLVPVWLATKVGGIAQSIIGRHLSNPSLFSLFVIGMGNGLLPCGLVVTALVGSLASGAIVSSMMFMAVFGIGTLPSMLVASISASVLSITARQRLRYAAPFLALLVGGAIILRGMNLGIPFVSPAVSTSQQHGTSSCCSH
jgi:sulfite exporter TauE/SafE